MESYHPTRLVQYREPGTVVTHLVTGDPHAAPKEFREDGAGADGEVPPQALVIYAVYDPVKSVSRVYAANDVSNRMCLATIAGPLAHLFWSDEQLVHGVTVDGTLHVFGHAGSQGSHDGADRDDEAWAELSSLRLPGVVVSAVPPPKEKTSSSNGTSSSSTSHTGGVVFDCVMGGDRTLAVLTGPDATLLRMFNARTQDHFKLEVPPGTLPSGTRLKGLDYDVGSGTLAVGTSDGHVLFWQHGAHHHHGGGGADGGGGGGPRPDLRTTERRSTVTTSSVLNVGVDVVDTEPEKSWRLKNVVAFAEAGPGMGKGKGMGMGMGGVTRLVLGPAGRSVAVEQAGGEIALLRSARPTASMDHGLACVQISATEFSIDSDRGGHGMQVQTAMQIEGLSHTRKHVLAWSSGGEVQVYGLTREGPVLKHSFVRGNARKPHGMVLWGKALYECSVGGLTMLDLAGRALHELPVEAAVGPPSCVALRGSTLLALTRDG